MGIDVNQHLLNEALTYFFEFLRLVWLLPGLSLLHALSSSEFFLWFERG